MQYTVPTLRASSLLSTVEFMDMRHSMTSPNGVTGAVRNYTNMEWRIRRLYIKRETHFKQFENQYEWKIGCTGTNH